MAEEIGGASATAAASLVSIIAIFNGIGRFAWASFSDFIGRRWVFLVAALTLVFLAAGFYGATRASAEATPAAPAPAPAPAT